MLWAITKQPVAAIALSIISDALASIPTLIKSWRYPETETPIAYITALFSVSVGFHYDSDLEFFIMRFPDLPGADGDHIYYCTVQKEDLQKTAFWVSLDERLRFAMKLKDYQIAKQLHFTQLAIMILVLAMGIISYIAADRLWESAVALHDHPFTTQGALASTQRDILKMRLIMEQVRTGKRKVRTPNGNGGHGCLCGRIR